MSRVLVRGVGAVSPAGWGTAALREALHRGTRIPAQELACPDHSRPLKVLRVPAPAARPSFLGNARLRRTSPIAHFGVSAALEALGADAADFSNGAAKLGIIYCAMAGCVNFSRRFYDETLKDPATASPLIFPETVFNAPASHLGALLGTRAINYTLVGDPGTFLQGLALAADWLVTGRVDGCLVVGAEELDWLVASASSLFDREAIIGEGAGALYLRTDKAGTRAVELQAVTDAHLFARKSGRAAAASKARAQAGASTRDSLWCDGTLSVPRLDQDEELAWADWVGNRLSPKRICGEAFMASSAWQCVAAVDALADEQYQTSLVSVVGCNQQAIAARFGRS